MATSWSPRPGRTWSSLPVAPASRRSWHFWRGCRQGLGDRESMSLCSAPQFQLSRTVVPSPPRRGALCHSGTPQHRVFPVHRLVLRRETCTCSTGARHERLLLFAPVARRIAAASPCFQPHFFVEEAPGNRFCPGDRGALVGRHGLAGVGRPVGCGLLPVRATGYAEGAVTGTAEPWCRRQEHPGGRVGVARTVLNRHRATRCARRNRQVFLPFHRRCA